MYKINFLVIYVVGIGVLMDDLVLIKAMILTTTTMSCVSFSIYCTSACTRYNLLNNHVEPLHLRGHDYVIELLSRNYDRKCFDCFRMKIATFIKLCEDLKSKTNLKASKYLSIQEKVVFL